MGKSVINIRVIPRAKLNKVCPPDENETESPGGAIIRVYITAAPADGKANEAAVKLLSAYFGVSKSRIRIIRGETSRNKQIIIDKT
jgi:uncharacterized protein (TIGR00251 family)